MAAIPGSCPAGSAGRSPSHATPPARSSDRPPGLPPGSGSHAPPAPEPLSAPLRGARSCAAPLGPARSRSAGPAWARSAPLGRSCVWVVLGRSCVWVVRGRSCAGVARDGRMAASLAPISFRNGYAARAGAAAPPVSERLRGLRADCLAGREAFLRAVRASRPRACRRGRGRRLRWRRPRAARPGLRRVRAPGARSRPPCACDASRRQAPRLPAGDPVHWCRRSSCSWLSRTGSIRQRGTEGRARRERA